MNPDHLPCPDCDGYAEVKTSHPRVRGHLVTRRCLTCAGTGHATR
jgi:DnaJ-class molecular chaperone